VKVLAHLPFFSERMSEVASTAQEAISQVLPLLAGSPEKIDVLPVGGKGLTLT
jgi:hypothetical protein